MTAERLAVRTLREILRIYFANGHYGSRLIAAAAGCSKSMVNQTIKAAGTAGLTNWADVEPLSEEDLQGRLYPPAEPQPQALTPKRRPEPHWAEVHEQLHRSDHQVTL